MTIESFKSAQAILGGLVALSAVWQAPQALAILPPHGPNIGIQGETSSLFLTRSNPKEHFDAQVQISNLSDKISHLEDPSFIRPVMDMSKLSPQRREIIERALSMSRLHVLAHLLTQRGTLLAAIGEKDKAIADLGEALDSDNSYFEAYNNRACLKAAKGDFDGALADANKALSLSPNFAEAYDTRGAVYLAKKQYTQAQKDFDRAIAARPDYAEAFYHRSLLMKALGKHNNYAADLKKAKELGY